MLSHIIVVRLLYTREVLGHASIEYAWKVVKLDLEYVEEVNKND